MNRAMTVLFITIVAAVAFWSTMQRSTMQRDELIERCRYLQKEIDANYVRMEELHAQQSARMLQIEERLEWHTMNTPMHMKGIE